MERSTPEERLHRIHQLLNELGEEESEKKSHERRIADLRNELSILVAEEADGKVVLPGLARAELTAPTVAVSYERQAVEQVIDWLDSTGFHDQAARLRGCRKLNHRAGTLRVTFEQR